jgi:outer membrane protein assembly factor BamB
MVRTAGDGRVFVESSRCVSGCEGDAFGNYRGVLLALEASDGRTAWKLRGGVGTGEPLWWATAVTDGLVYVNQVRGFETPRVAALATADGRMRWSASFGRRAYADVTAVADGRVFVGAASGYTAHPNVGGSVFVFALP